MSSLLAAYAVVTIAVLLYRVRLARLQRAIEAEIQASKRQSALFKLARRPSSPLQ